MLKYLSLLCVILFLGCAGQKPTPTPQPKYPWDVLPAEEKYLYEVAFQCPKATERINVVRGWETVEVLPIGPPAFDLEGQLRTVQDPNDSEKEVWLFYVKLPIGLTLAYGAEDTETESIGYVDYFALRAGVDETKATGQYFCQAEVSGDDE